LKSISALLVIHSGLKSEKKVQFREAANFASKAKIDVV
jgi:hypothetical protein